MQPGVSPACVLRGRPQQKGRLNDAGTMGQGALRADFACGAQLVKGKPYDL